MSPAALEWGGLALLLALLLGADLLLSRRQPRVGLRQALVQAGVWGLLAALFGTWVLARRGADGAAAYASGYLLELSLSVDNLFVFLLIFQGQRVPAGQRRRALAWGVLGAVFLRLVCVGLGAALVARFEWVLWIFGAFLLLTGLRLARHAREATPTEGGRSLRLWLGRWLRLSPDFEADGAFVVRRQGRWSATPLLLVVLMIEVSDLLFAVDSIPAVFGVTHDPWVAFSSNVFAILGLRALYFALEGLLPLFAHLKTGLAVLLALIGAKMLALPLAERLWGFHLEHAGAWTLGMVAAVLGAAVLVSMVDGKKGAA